jgi:hypothetical protein
MNRSKRTAVVIKEYGYLLIKFHFIEASLQYERVTKHCLSVWMNEEWMEQHCKKNI